MWNTKTTLKNGIVRLHILSRSYLWDANKRKYCSVDIGHLLLNGVRKIAAELVGQLIKLKSIFGVPCRWRYPSRMFAIVQRIANNFSQKTLTPLVYTRLTFFWSLSISPWTELLQTNIIAKGEIYVAIQFSSVMPRMKFFFYKKENLRKGIFYYSALHKKLFLFFYYWLIFWSLPFLYFRAQKQNFLLYCKFTICVLTKNRFLTLLRHVQPTYQLWQSIKSSWSLN